MAKVPPSLEVNGAYLLGIIGSLSEDDVRPYREKHGLTYIEADKWYSAQQVSDFYYDLEQAPNGMFNLVAIGVNVADKVVYPPEVRTMDDALALAPQMHYAGWRNGHPGDIQVERFGPKHVRFIFTDLPLPIDLVYGLCYGLVKRFSPPGTRIRAEQHEQGNAKIYDLEW